jgi:hypothetical protein
VEEYVPPRDIVNGVAVDKAVFVPAVILKGGVNPAVPIPMFPEYSANPIVPSALTLKDGMPDISDTAKIQPEDRLLLIESSCPDVPSKDRVLSSKTLNKIGVLF